MNISFVQKYRYFNLGLAVKNGDGKFSQIQLFYFVKPMKKRLKFGIL